jgi:hypothetical protein
MIIITIVRKTDYFQNLDINFLKAKKNKNRLKSYKNFFLSHKIIEIIYAC